MKDWILVIMGLCAMVDSCRAGSVSQYPKVVQNFGEAEGPCAKSLSDCPLNGCEATGSPHSLLNAQKHAKPKGTATVRLSFADFRALQDLADTRVGQAVELPAEGRWRLRGLTVKAGVVSEGDLIEVSGFLVGVPHANVGGESVNCRLKGTEANDFHIPFAADATDTEYEGIVVEMVPQGRPAGWNLKKLRLAAKAGRMVRFRGALFYDNMHRVNEDPEDPKTGQPKRFSLWEVHPVSSAEVCPTSSCGPDSKDWKTLESLP